MNLFLRHADSPRASRAFAGGWWREMKILTAGRAIVNIRAPPLIPDRISAGNP
jgi:hypothetical protein